MFSRGFENPQNKTLCRAQGKLGCREQASRNLMGKYMDSRPNSSQEFEPGQIVFLKSDPSVRGAVVGV